MPVILGPDGPSLGGFVCPATVVAAPTCGSWASCGPGDRVRFVPVDQAGARALEQAPGQGHRDACSPCQPPMPRPPRAPWATRGPWSCGPREHPRRGRLPPRGRRVPAGRVRPAGAGHRAALPGACPDDWPAGQRAHPRRRRPHARHPLAAGALRQPRSCPWRELLRRCCGTWRRAWRGIEDLEVPARIVHLPLSWDDPATRLAIEKYMQSVRTDAPWCPSNIEFIRRINGLGQHRGGAATSSSTPATWCWAWATSTSARRWPRRWTRATGWSPPSTTRRAPGRRRTRSASAAPISASTAWKAPAATSSSAAPCRCGTAMAAGRGTSPQPWLLRFFDQIRFYPVSEAELLELREDFPRGRLSAADRGDALQPAGLPALPGRQRGVHRRLQGPPAGRLRGRAGALGRCRPGGPGEPRPASPSTSGPRSRPWPPASGRWRARFTAASGSSRGARADGRRRARCCWCWSR